MSMTLTEILDLTGKLDDMPGEDTARARFRRHLAREMSEPGRIRDFVEECLRNAGDQYNRALQDLVNQIGILMEFEVTPGRYQGGRCQGRCRKIRLPFACRSPWFSVGALG